MPRFRLPAPLRGSTPRQCLVSASPLHRCAAPLRMTQRVWRIVEYNLFVAMLLYLADSHCTTHATISPLCHSERSGKDIGIQAIKLRFAAESNPEGAPAGGISALVYGIVQPLISNIHPKRNDTRVVLQCYIPDGLRTLQGRNPQGAPRKSTRFRPFTNLNHFYPVAERNGMPLSKSRWTGFGSEQPEFVARNTATPKFAPQKERGKNPLG